MDNDDQYLAKWIWRNWNGSSRGVITVITDNDVQKPLREIIAASNPRHNGHATIIFSVAYILHWSLYAISTPFDAKHAMQM